MPLTVASPTLSQIRAWDIEHLTDAAIHWTTTANTWEDAFIGVAQQLALPGGTPWEGEAAETAQTQAYADRRQATVLADQLRNAARIAHTGASDLANAQLRVLHAVGDAQRAGFAVGEDLSVTDSQNGWPPAVRAVRRGIGERHATVIRSRAGTLAALDVEVAAKITAATSGIGDAPLEVKPDSIIQAAGFHTAPIPEGPKNPAPTPPPGGWSEDPITRSAQKIAYGHSYVAHSDHFFGMTRDDLARHIEKMFRANAENPASLTIGRTGDNAAVLYDPKTNIVVIRDPAALDAGTAFKPDRGAGYMESPKVATRVPSIPLAELADGPIRPAPPVGPNPPEPTPRTAPPVRGVPLLVPELVEPRAGDVPDLGPLEQQPQMPEE
jgi:hypothetical protein